MIALLFTALVAAGAVGYAVWPLFAHSPRSESEEPEVDVLRERQQAAVEALRELDYEREIGKLTDAEYFTLRDRYARQAMALLKLLDQRESAREQALERAIAARRGAGPGREAGPVAPGRRASGNGGAVVARSGRRWLIGTGGAALALAVALALLVSTVHRGNARPEVVGQVPPQARLGLAFDPSEPGRLLAVGANSIMASTDGGKMWQDVRPMGVSMPAGGPTTSIQSIFPSLDGRGVLVPAPGQGLLRSTDGGRNWAAVTDGPSLPAGARALAEVPGTPPLLLAASPEGVEASADNGRNWGVADGFVNGLLPTKNVRDVAYAATADQSTGPQGQVFHGRLFAATDRGLFVSRDGAQSWLALPLGGDLVAVAVDPRNPSVILAMDGQGELFRSDNGGSTWLSQNG